MSRIKWNKGVYNVLIHKKDDKLVPAVGYIGAEVAYDLKNVVITRDSASGRYLLLDADNEDVKESFDPRIWEQIPDDCFQRINSTHDTLGKGKPKKKTVKKSVGVAPSYAFIKMMHHPDPEPKPTKLQSQFVEYVGSLEHGEKFEPEVLKDWFDKTYGVSS